MLLSHNFELSEEILPKLSREEFTEVFEEGLSKHPQISCRLVNNPHWIVEVLFPTDDLSPKQVGEMCAQALRQKRLPQKQTENLVYDILILGGRKTTPAMSSSPDSLQPGEWGVDVVETISGQQFLSSIDWEVKTAGKSEDRIFKVELKAQL
ncbi:MAG: DUF2656 domain-containing protein [Moorea sp. SIO2B7]|nr:DUF2656 domain-containing protein [Moorena sp. SIO2B7]